MKRLNQLITEGLVLDVTDYIHWRIEKQSNIRAILQFTDKNKSKEKRPFVEQVVELAKQEIENELKGSLNRLKDYMSDVEIVFTDDNVKLDVACFNRKGYQHHCAVYIPLNDDAEVDFTGEVKSDNASVLYGVKQHLKDFAKIPERQAQKNPFFKARVIASMFYFVMKGAIDECDNEFFKV